MRNHLMWLLFLCIAVLSNAEENPYIEALKMHPWKSVQRYVEVRPGAHLFYWLYYADGTRLGANHKPLLIWIQGGPGLAASGIANFAEIGPLDMDMKPRNHSWVNGRNVLLIDHPAGTGFSYVTDKSLHVKNDREAGIDLSKLIKMFFRRHKEFQKTPTYIFGQSYGGKLLPRLAYYLYTAIANDRLKMNFKGIGIGSGWVDPKESTARVSLYHVEMLLNKTKLKIAVYNGNLDVVTPLAGASNWAHKLRWYGAKDFKFAKRNKIRGYRNGFYKATDQFSFWGVFGSGHWVPEDNPQAMEHILEHLLEDLK